MYFYINSKQLCIQRKSSKKKTAHTVYLWLIKYCFQFIHMAEVYSVFFGAFYFY